MKVYVRTLRPSGACPLWRNETERAKVRQDLNNFGFYVLTGIGDSLEVWAISDEKAWDIRLFEKVLDKIRFFWYNQKTKLKFNN